MYKKLLGIIIILASLLTSGFVIANQSEPLGQSVLRLHVIANSDDTADQALKMRVKDDIVAMMKEEFSDVKDAEEARKLAQQDIPRIKAAAEARIKASGYEYPVQVKVGEYDFPTKSYGNLVFPPGRYQAVRVIIGEGEGKNWWCVLFPPLCLVSSADQGLSMNSPQQAQVTFKCLELLPRGVKVGKQLPSASKTGQTATKESEIRQTTSHGNKTGPTAARDSKIRKTELITIVRQSFTPKVTASPLSIWNGFL